LRRLSPRPHQRIRTAVTCIERFEQGRFLLAVSPEILAELRDVLSRSKLRQDFPLLTDKKQSN
jgi:predicted nucleic acid-binding protein